MTASATADLELMRASVLLDSDPATAAKSATEILARFPGHPEANLLLAAACRRLGDGRAAVPVLESLAAANPDSALLALELGRGLASSARPADARGAFKRAIALDAGLADAWRELAQAEFLLGEETAGDAAYAEFSRLTPEPIEFNDVLVALADNRLAAAEAMLRQHLKRTPEDVVALRMLADTVLRRDDPGEAERSLRAALELAPGYAAARLDLARLLYAKQMYGEVLPLVERLLRVDPENIAYLSLKAQALRLVGRSAEAVALMEGAVRERPTDAQAWLLYGHLMREVGEPAEAIAAYRHALAVQPQQGEAYWSLANLKTFRFEEADLAAMQARLGEAGLRAGDRTHLEFALGKALEDRGEYPDSFEHYARGNALQRAKTPYDASVVEADVRRSVALYTAPFFAARQGFGSERTDPIFVVGLPRSGSTLIEQILASHSAVEGTRELDEIPGIVRDLVLRSSTRATPAYPEPVAGLDAAGARALAERYLARTQPFRSTDKARFVDKMLANFGHVGLIHLLFPRATIIDARRHPLGCGMSCYRQLFARGLGFTYDLEEFGRHYRAYAELMAHLDQVLPGRVHRVYYEALVAHPEREVRRLLEHCGLPFEEACLRFYETKRIVQTISTEQVRRPIYSESVGQWRHFEPWLGPMQAALGDLIERYPILGG